MKKRALVAILIFSCFSLFSLQSFSQAITADTTSANQYFDLARKYENSSKYDSAIIFAEKAQPLYIKYFGEKSVKNANVLHLLGRLCYGSNKNDLALEYYFKALQIRKEILGEKVPEVAAGYNNIGLAYFHKSEYDKGFEYHLKALQIREEIFGENNADVAKSLLYIGLFYEYKGEYDKALECFLRILKIKKVILGEKHPEVAITYNNIGVVYFDKGEYDKALEYYFKDLEIRKEVYGEKVLAGNYNNIGNVYYVKGEYDKALEYQFKALQLRKKFLGEKDSDVAMSYNNIGIVYVAKGEYDKALENYFKALQISKETRGEKDPSVAESYNNIGIVYNDKREYDKALDYHLKALQIRKEALGEKHPYVAMSYDNIGAVYELKGEHDKALEYLFNGLKIRKEILGDKHPDVASSYNNIGHVYNKKGEYLKALEYYQKGAASCMYNFNDTVDVYKTPTIRSYLRWDYLLESLQAKAQIIADKNNMLTGRTYNERKKIALRHFQACDTLIDIIRKEISTQSDKLALGEKATKVYKEAIDFLTPLQTVDNREDMQKMSADDRNLAFYFSEKNKSSVLLEALAGQEAMKFGGIPDSLLLKEHNLKTDIALYTKQLSEPQKLDSAKSKLFQERLFLRNRSYDSLIMVFEKQFPEYHDMKYNNKPATVKDIQKLLDKETAMISYIVGDSTLAIFTLTKSNLDVKRVPKITNLDDTIGFFRSGLTLGMQKIYRRLGYKLYQQLFPATAPLDGKIENLFIIPDGSLATIPFESLLTENYTGDLDANIEYPYLIKKYDISYSYSGNLFSRTFTKEASSTIEITKLNDWLAFAPVFDNEREQSMVMSSQELQRQLSELKTDSTMVNRSMFNGNYIKPLPASETETEAIFKLYDDNNLKAKVLLHNNANEKSVKSGELEQYKVLHFATHGFVNSERPELSGLLLAQDTTGGEDGVLYSGEIYNLKLNADLVVLSACETGLGKIQKGEGIIGLTRALLYAGAKNIIVSLWEVLDKSTSDLMVDFYKNSLSGKGKLSYSEALRNAKLKMISEGKYAHPFFWSPFILIGK